LEKGLLYGYNKVVCYLEANWAGSPFDIKSSFGYCVSIDDNLIAWKSKKQNVVARYSAKVEYRAMTLVT